MFAAPTDRVILSVGNRINGIGQLASVEPIAMPLIFTMQVAVGMMCPTARRSLETT